MLQVDICPFASDALEDAMRLAQTKSLNSYTFSDCFNFLNYVWSDIYSQICMIDSGYYSKTVLLTSELTKIPRFVKNTVLVYSAQSPKDYSRQVFRQSGDSDQGSSLTYRISGTDLYCPDARRRKVFLEYCPQPAQIFFTHHNRDPKLYPDGHDIKRNSIYNLWKLVNDKGLDVANAEVTQEQIAECTSWRLKHRANPDIPDNDITDYIIRDPDYESGKWELKYISCDYPYIFCSYQNNITGEWHSGFFNKNLEWTDYNPFEWTGRNDNVEYLECHYNDKTGLGVIVRDWNDIETKLLNTDKLPEMANSIIFVENYFEYKATDGTVLKLTQGYWFNRYATDFNYEKVPEVTEYPESPDDGDVINLNGTLYRYSTENDAWAEVDNIKRIAQEETKPRVKELGWTPDTRLVYPAPEVYRYLVARLAEKFSALNESNIMGVQSELADAKFAFQAFLKKDKSAWERMRNVNPATLTDWL